MALHPCPRCKKLIPAGAAYCDSCKPLAEAAAQEAMERRRAHKKKIYNAEYNKRRDTKYLAFYRSKAWRTTSKAYLQSVAYKCEARLEGCGRVACEVHHVKPLKTAEGWAERLTWANLMGVCVSCHNKLDNKCFTSRPRQTEFGVIDMRDLSFPHTPPRGGG